MALDSTQDYRLSLWSDPLAVRDASKKSSQQWRNWHVPTDLCDTAEIVLAEVLNNIVEHAHKDQGHGSLVVMFSYDGTALSFEVRDDGIAMPGGTLPEGKPQDLGTELEDLPEGGFGWHLIRAMTKKLAYQRTDSWNILTFSVCPDP